MRPEVEIVSELEDLKQFMEHSDNEYHDLPEIAAKIVALEWALAVREKFN